jgi:predicted transcriptional regulator
MGIHGIDCGTVSVRHERGDMTKTLEIHVDDSAEALAWRLIDAWHRADRGEAVEEHHLSFESWAGLTSVLTPRRLELLRHLRRHPATRIAELARALGRDYKRVHADVQALAAAGLIDRTAAGLRAGYGENSHPDRCLTPKAGH